MEGATNDTNASARHALSPLCCCAALRTATSLRASCRRARSFTMPAVGSRMRSPAGRAQRCWPEAAAAEGRKCVLPGSPPSHSCFSCFSCLSWLLFPVLLTEWQNFVMKSPRIHDRPLPGPVAETARLKSAKTAANATNLLFIRIVRGCLEQAIISPASQGARRMNSRQIKNRRFSDTSALRLVYMGEDCCESHRHGECDLG